MLTIVLIILIILLLFGALGTAPIVNPRAANWGYAPSAIQIILIVVIIILLLRVL